MERDAPAQALVQGKTLQEGRHTSVWAAFLLSRPGARLNGSAGKVKAAAEPGMRRVVTLYTVSSCCTQ